MVQKDFRAYNKDTGQWEVLFANNDDFNTIVAISNDLNARFPKYIYSNIADWNTITESGMYMGNGNSLNGPTDLVGDHSQVGIYTAHLPGYGVLETQQVFEPFMKTYRYKTNGNWTKWYIGSPFVFKRDTTFNIIRGIGANGDMEVPYDKNGLIPKSVSIYAWIEGEPYYSFGMWADDTSLTTGFAISNRQTSIGMGIYIAAMIDLDEYNRWSGFYCSLRSVDNGKLLFNFVSDNNGNPKVWDETSTLRLAVKMTF